VSLGWHSSIDRALIGALHAAGLSVAVWTVDDPDIAKMARDAGVDILMTNRPGEIREALRGGG
jgi:glycerophosphoryl diester phosphodiesterase